MLRDHEKRTGPSPFALVLIFLLLIHLSSTTSFAGQITDKEKQEFFKAVEAGDLEKVKMFVNDDPEFLKVENINNWNVLDVSAEKGHLNIVKFCISRGMDPKGKNIYDTPPLIYAVLSDSPETVRFLIDKGADVKGTRANSPINCAINRGNSDIIKLLISKGANPNQRDNGGRTPMLNAAYSGKLDLVKLIMANGGDDSLIDKEGDNIFDISVLSGNMELISFLESEGYKPSDEVKIAFYAVSNGKLEVIKHIVKEGFDAGQKFNGEPMLYALSFGNADKEELKEIIRYLVSLGADVNATDSSGRTILFNSILCCNNEIIDYLISIGADVNQKDSYGTSPILWTLHFLYDDNEYTIIRKLIDSGADVNGANNFGSRPLDIAAFEGSIRTIKLLESKGAAFGKTGILGPLHFAASKQNFDALKYYVEKGFDVNSRCSEGNTPLHYAMTESLITSYNRSVRLMEGAYPCYKPNLQMIKYLLSKGARIDAKNNKGEQPIHFALEDYSSYKEARSGLINYLLSQGADANARDNEGNTPLHFSKYEVNFCKILVSHGADVNAKNKKGESPLYYLIKYYEPMDNNDVLKYLLSKGAIPGPAELKLIYESKNWKVIPIIFTYSRPLQIGATISIILLTTILFLLFRNRRKKIPATGDESDKSTDEVNTVKGV